MYVCVLGLDIRPPKSGTSRKSMILNNNVCSTNFESGTKSEKVVLNH